MANHTQDAQDEPELVELHFELEIDYRHAFEENEIITQCIAEVMKIPKGDVFFDGVDEIMKDNQYCGLFRGHIPTTKHEIEKLVSIFYNSLQTQVLQRKIVDYSGIENPVLEIRELYETDQNEEETFDDNYNQSLNHPSNNIIDTNNDNMQININGLDAIDGQQMMDPYNSNPTQQQNMNEQLRRDRDQRDNENENRYAMDESQQLNSETVKLFNLNLITND